MSQSVATKFSRRPLALALSALLLGGVVAEQAAAQAFPAAINLSSLDGSNGFRVDGVAESQFSGFSVSAAGDINGDGFGELIVAAPFADPNGSSSGSSYVVFGKAAPVVPTLALSSLDGSIGFRLDGVAGGDRSGYSVSAAGDINGDGLGDLIVGADSADPNASESGSSYVVFGKTTPFASTLALSSLDGSNGFRLDGLEFSSQSGKSVSAAGDINGDGLDDLIVGAYRTDPNGYDSGSSYVVFGKTTPFAASLELSSLDGNNGFRLDGVAAFDLSGRSVSGAGDVNGDGIDDLIIGAFRADPNDESSGSSYVVFGKTTPFAPTFALSSLNGSNGFRLDGVAFGDFSGSSVSAAGDINGDGLGDVLIGAFRADPNGGDSGSSYVVFGKTTPFASTSALSSLDGSNGFRLDGVAGGDQAGRQVSSAGDINGDGLGDLIVGAPYADPNGSDSGSSYVVFGKTAPFTATLALSSLDGSNGLRLDGVVDGDQSGVSVSAAGDVNGDGLGDVIIGARRADPNGTDSGSSYVVFGRRAAGLNVVQSDGNTAVTEGGNTDTFTVALSSQPSADVSIALTSVQVTATPTPLVFTPSNWNDARTVTVTAIDDALFETNPHPGSVSFAVSSGDASYNGFAVPDVAVSVTDNNSAPVITISSPSQAEGNTGPTPMNFMVNLSAISGRDVSFNVATADGTAVAGSDYVVIPSGPLTITAGQQMLTIPVTINGDTMLEANESFSVVLSAIDGATPSMVTGTGTIVDDDQQLTTTTIASDMPDASLVGQPYTVVVDVLGSSSSPAGTLTISDGSDSCGPVTLVAGTSPASSASCAMTSNSAGSKTLTATYTPASGAFATSSGTDSHQVDPASTSISVSGSPRTRINTATPFGFALAVAAPGGGTPTGTVTLSSGDSSCQLSVPPAMSSCDLSFDLLGPRTVNAIFNSTDGNHENADSSGAGDLQTLIFAQSDLAVAKTDTVDTYAEGDLLVYTITLENLGADTAQNLRLSDTVPAGLVNVQWSCSASGGGVCPANSGVDDIDAQIPSYPVGALLNYSFSGTVVGQPEQILNTATLTLPADDTIEDGNLANNSASDLNRRDLLFADSFETVMITAAAGSYRLPSAELLAVLDGTATAVFVLNDADGQAARIYARVFDGQLQYALAQRASNGLLRLDPWMSYSSEPLLSWSASAQARGWLVASVGLE